MRSDKPGWQQRIARERIEILFGLARKSLAERPDRSRRYVGLARKIGMRYRVRLPRDLKDSFCKRCDTLLVQGRTATTRLDSRSKSVIIKCGECNYSQRKPYK